MKTCALILALAGALHAAVLKGSVVEQQTGRPLARALVVVRPVAGTHGATESVRTESDGTFRFASIAAGQYVVTASKLAFAPVEYGQKRWKAPGVPVVIEEGSERTLKIALPRLGAIIGRVVDENDVGLAEHEVVAYQNTRPPRLVERAVSDDRGVFRLPELEPGTYLVRTAAKVYDDGAYLPTFYRDVQTVDGARSVEVGIDRDTTDIVIRPMPGALYSISGKVQAPATVTVSSDMGSVSQITGAGGTFQFQHLAPGKYDVTAVTPEGRGETPLVGFQEIELFHDRSDLFLRLGSVPEVRFVFQDPQGAAVDANGVQVFARREDLWGEGKPQFLALKDNATGLMPGRWLFSLAPNASYYVAGYEAPRVIEPGNSQVKFVLSRNPATIRGTVSGAAAGAPVMLERDGEIRTTRADVNGAFEFAGLAPGSYRLLSSFDAADPRESGAAVQVTIAEGARVVQDLSLVGR